MGKKRSATISDVAREAGVANATVSMVTRNKPGISDETRQRVLAVAKRLNYRASPNRQTRSRTHYNQLGFLLVSPHEPRVTVETGSAYLHTMIDGCLHCAEADNWSVALCKCTLAQLQEGQLPTALTHQLFDGLLVRSIMDPALLELLSEMQVPHVLIDCDRFVSQSVQVQIENTQAIDELVEHLVESGSRKVATITGEMDHLNAQERLAALHMALGRRGQSLLPERIVYETGFDEESGRRGVEVLLARGVEFDTLVCHNDLIGLGALNRLASAGLSVPHDVRVSGFDNMEFSAHLPVPLTSVDPQPAALAETATRLLLEMIDSKDRSPLHLKLPTRLCVRTSSSKVETSPREYSTS